MIIHAPPQMSETARICDPARFAEEMTTSPGGVCQDLIGLLQNPRNEIGGIPRFDTLAAGIASPFPTGSDQIFRMVDPLLDKEGDPAEALKGPCASDKPLVEGRGCECNHPLPAIQGRIESRAKGPVGEKETPKGSANQVRSTLSKNACRTSFHRHL